MTLPARAWIGLVVCLLAASPVSAQQPGWSGTGALTTPRLYGHTATLLVNGKVLVVGGIQERVGFGGIATNSAELYDPATGQWSAASSLTTPRSGHIAVRLLDGKVLVAGGDDGVYRGALVTTAEIYDPDTSVWSPAGKSIGGGKALLLADGRVLVLNHGSTELYDPATGVWSQGALMNAAHASQTATLLPGGKVLVAGGDASPRGAEIYDPVSGRWTITGNLITGRLWDHKAALLANGKVLVAGGGISGDDYCDGIDSAELYDPATGQWSPTGSLISTRNDYFSLDNLILLPNGKVLTVGGGSAGECRALKTADLYDSATGRWSATGSLLTGRISNTTTLLANGKVLVAGGFDFDGDDAISTSAEVFDSGTASVTSVSTASFAAGGALAPDSIAAALGMNLATGIQTALSGSLPTELAGMSVSVRDRFGAERAASLFFASPGLINYQVPRGTAAGLATVTVTSGNSLVAAGVVEIAGVAPGLFSANSSGRGAAAGFWIRVTEGGVRSQGYLFDSVTFKPVPVDLGPAGDRVFLSLYGTGFRAGASATAKVGGVGVPVYGFAPVTAYPGLDVVNIGPLPRQLAGRGEVDVTFSVDGKAANTVGVSSR